MYEIEIKQKIQELTGYDDIKLTATPIGVKGDLSINVARLFKSSESIITKLVNGLGKLSCIEELDLINSGFLNIKLSEKAVINELVEILKNPLSYGSLQCNDSIILEMVSSNPTGPLHIGHGRGAAIGDTLGRIYASLGYNVYREYYVNDAGKQIKKLGESVYNSILGNEPPEGGYKGDYICDIAKKFSSCRDAEECAKQASMEILNGHMKVLKDFGVSFDNVFSEAVLIEKGKVENAVKSLQQKGLTYNDKGALWFKSSKFGDNSDRVLIKENGDLTYFASDCAYHSDKAERFSYLLNIWGADHHGYIPRLNAYWEAMGYNNNKKIDILLYQFVNLKRGDKKISMSTRAGEYVTLKEVVDEVGKDAARFFLLMRSADAPLEFDLELARQESKKNPVYYVQYSHARICSVFRKAKVVPDNIECTIPIKVGIQEIELIKKLAHFPYLLLKCMELKAPHMLTEYIRDIATAFHKYYDTVRVLGTEMEESRLLLLKAVKIIIERGLNITGVNAPERM